MSNSEVVHHYEFTDENLSPEMEDYIIRGFKMVLMPGKLLLISLAVLIITLGIVIFTIGYSTMFDICMCILVSIICIAGVMAFFMFSILPRLNVIRAMKKHEYQWCERKLVRSTNDDNKQLFVFEDDISTKPIAYLRLNCPYDNILIKLDDTHIYSFVKP